MFHPIARLQGNGIPELALRVGLIKFITLRNLMFGVLWRRKDELGTQEIRKGSFGHGLNTD